MEKQHLLFKSKEKRISHLSTSGEWLVVNLLSFFTEGNSKPGGIEDGKERNV